MLVPREYTTAEIRPISPHKEDISKERSKVKKKEKRKKAQKPQKPESMIKIKGVITCR